MSTFAIGITRQGWLPLALVWYFWRYGRHAAAAKRPDTRSVSITELGRNLGIGFTPGGTVVVMVVAVLPVNPRVYRVIIGPRFWLVPLRLPTPTGTLAAANPSDAGDADRPTYGGSDAAGYYGPEEDPLPGPKSTERGGDPEERTGSPFDYLNEVLDSDQDLTYAKEALDSTRTRDTINRYGENMTILAPENRAFGDQPPDQWNEADKERFLANHAIPGQRVPIYPEDVSNPAPADGIVAPNLSVPGSPLVHKVDRLRYEPIGPMAVMAMQPVLSSALQLVRFANFEPELNRGGTFFCPYNNPMTRQIAANADPSNRRQVSGILGDLLPIEFEPLFSCRVTIRPFGSRIGRMSARNDQPEWHADRLSRKGKHN